VPIISRNFRHFKRDDTLVSLAGPASNLLLAVLAFLGLAMVLISERHLPELATPSTLQQSLVLLFTIALQLNLTLCIFNLIPIPPLDGSHLLRHVLPYGATQVFDRVTGVASYLLIIIVGRVVLGIILYPIMGVLYSVLNHI
jgi:Zn-dependent protease